MLVKAANAPLKRLWPRSSKFGVIKQNQSGSVLLELMTLNLQDRWLCHIVIIARLRGISWSKAAKSKDYHLCSNRVNVADIWRERAYTLRVEVSQWFYQSSNNEQCEVSRAHSSEEVSVMEM